MKYFSKSYFTLDDIYTVIVLSIMSLSPTMVSLVLPSDIKALLHVISDKLLPANQSILSFAISNKSLPVGFSVITICNSSLEEKTLVSKS